ncbi:hypothetical protein INS49_004609 [Diaporthe citri]|uniref:uncharacterized protein n=1 Tax=Diaporthe citri TaxID=83186 RepID=UPI001C801D6B|nr:uncharacterized protein INS49_004609 [Diaporthe citri]KAG6354591.1 hypothetical protein INS49_004609 [Diaporthe citri]
MGYSVPEQKKQLLNKGILENPLIAPDLPTGAAEAASKISFTGSDLPSIPINWRFAESVSALKAYEATLVNVLLKRKYGLEPVSMTIETDHAQLFIMSSLLWTIDPAGENLSAMSNLTSPKGRAKLSRYFPDWDIHRSKSSIYRMAATNIYKTLDGRFFRLHGSMNPDRTLDSIDMPHDMEFESMPEASAAIGEAVGKLTADKLQHRAADIYKQAGTICYTREQFRESEHGKANAHVGLFEICKHPNPQQKPCWWPDVPQTSAERPLAGLKVVDLSRVIAAPAVTRGLAELGASVMRINALLDVREEGDRATLRELILEADVFVQGYRPGVLDKYGFGEKDIVEMVQDRGRGIIYVRENCYGWNDPWKNRSGWQQISDANCGVSYEFGRAMGNDEPVTPVFPNSDYCTGGVGVAGVLTSLIRRAENGGSYSVDIALNYYSTWLVNSVGMYPDPVWQDLWKSNGSLVFRHDQPMQTMLAAMMQTIMKHSASKLFKPHHFTTYYCRYLQKDVKLVAPILQFPQGEVNPGYSVGTRTNGVDKPRWPADLTVEMVE